MKRWDVPRRTKKKLAAMKIPDTHLSAGTTSEDIVQNIINKVLT